MGSEERAVRGEHPNGHQSDWKISHRKTTK